jgi:hypothetical protein
MKKNIVIVCTAYTAGLGPIRHSDLRRVSCLTNQF